MKKDSYIVDRFFQFVDNIILKKKVSHAYLIEMDDYVDSFSYILDFVKMILCNITHDKLLDSSDPIIHLIDSNQYPDLYIVSSDTSVINKTLITKLKTEFNNKSFYDNKRIYIIKEAEKLNASSANTILKFLEEPESDIIAILLADDVYHVIDTIVSRCQILSLKNETNIVEFDDNILDFVDCMIHPEEYFIKYNYYYKDILVDKETTIIILKKIELLLLNYFLTRNSSNNSDLSSFLVDVSDKEIVNILSIIEKELPKLSFNVNYKLWLDSFFARLKIGG